ncbi:MAG TPA: M24 family metallopeptidase [Chloroflexota bacterium]|nr:M24 family metallopeptidase [Chloroflexota bacterium]
MIAKDRPRLDVPRFSLAERDRRFERVRRFMREAGVDCIVVPYNTGHWGQFQADAQYLTCMGGNDAEVCVVFPAEGEATAWVRSGRYIASWLGAQDWVTDIRNSGGVWGPPIVERLKELGLERATIGVVGLDGMTRAEEGVIPYVMMETFKRELPRATFVSATALMQEARAVKSEEEIAVLQRAAEIAELAAEAMREAARPGVPDALVFAAAYNAMLTNGGEVPTMLLWRAGPEAQDTFYLPTNRPLEPGDQIVTELEAKHAGYRAQVVQPLFISYPKDPYPEMLQVSIAAFNQLCALMRPGVTMGELYDACAAVGEGTGYQTRLGMHGRGLGEDRPLFSGGAGSEAIRRIKLEANNVFILKPSAATPDHQRHINWGDTVVVTPDGARRLGKRPQGYSVSA